MSIFAFRYDIDIIDVKYRDIDINIHPLPRYLYNSKYGSIFSIYRSTTIPHNPQFYLQTAYQLNHDIQSPFLMELLILPYFVVIIKIKSASCVSGASSTTSNREFIRDRGETSTVVCRGPCGTSVESMDCAFQGLTETSLSVAPCRGVWPLLAGLRSPWASMIDVRGHYETWSCSASFLSLS